MRKYFIIIVFLFSKLSQSQSKINFGLEPQISLSEGVHYYPLIGLNLIANYKNYEIHFGYNQTELGFGTYNVNGFLSGLKYHFLREEKISHFVVEFNVQNHKYWESIGTPPLNGNYNYQNTTYFDLVTGKTNSTAFLLGIGYEFKMNSHFSFYPCIGSGLVHKITTATDLGIQTYHSSRNRWEFSHYIKIAFKYYILRKYDKKSAEK